jgi:hypothetical protein
VRITRAWHEDDEITMELPMSVRLVKASDKVEEDLGKRSMEYGPIVYCVEETDNPAGLDNLSLSNEMNWSVAKKEDLLGGVNIVEGRNQQTGSDFTAIPYYAWSNRGIGTMKVWLPFEDNRP